ncbi:helix-turn-helix transcriptional regulator [Neobacillus sp. YIM B02564]|uniref:Helix-turn-helix transcriptional regulator n=1 Tax=Neobacillus paridis TaxID=2803862 RepID=A0ABS1TLC5_9BACI|nr:helix-turn-helix transcriptional regulator [Neobacillus paridis]MBL4952090.1 helix-turn-helix transcriptional regulator [Neobacillus paridis]
MIHIGKILKTKRKEANLSQKELAEKIHLSQSLISQLEKGKITPSLDVVQKLAHFFNLPVSHFMAEKEWEEGKEIETNQYYAEDTLDYIRLLFYQEQYEDAMKTIEQSLGTPLFQHETYYALIMLWKVMILKEQRKFEEAVKLCQYLLEDYTPYYSRVSLAQLYYHMGVCSLPIYLLEPKEFRFFDNSRTDQSIFLKSKECLIKAKNYLKGIYQHGRLYKEILYALGVLTASLGDFSNAMSYFKQCSRMYEEEISAYTKLVSNIEKIKYKIKEHPDKDTLTYDQVLSYDALFGQGLRRKA